MCVSVSMDCLCTEQCVYVWTEQCVCGLKVCVSVDCLCTEQCVYV